MDDVRTPSRLDAGIAGGLVVYALVEATVVGASAWWYAFALGATAPLAWRRVWPAPVLVTCLGAIVVGGVSGAGVENAVLPLPVMVVSAFTAGRYADGVRSTAVRIAGVVGAIVIAAVVLGPESENTPVEDLVALLVVIGGAGGIGQLVRIRSRENAQLRDLSRRLASEQEARAAAAVSEERVRVARELHDIVAHGIALIAVQAGAAGELVGRDDARARSSLDAIQQAARSALDEMRLMLSVLHDGSERAELEPQPGVRSIPDLVERVRAGGSPVTLREEGAAAPLPPGVDLSAYRIVQEALTNVVKHAAGTPAEVRLHHRREELVIEVSNHAGDPVRTDGTPGGGRGVAGMRERARIYGGTLETRRDRDRYVVRAVLPRTGRA